MAPPEAPTRVASASIAARSASSAEAPPPMANAASRAVPRRIIPSPSPVVEMAPATSSA